MFQPTWRLAHRITEDDSADTVCDFDVCLIQNSFVPSPSMSFNTLVEADYSGYSRPEVNPSFRINRANGSLDIIMQPADFSCTATTTPNTLYGYVVLDHNDGDPTTAILGSELFDQQIQMALPGDAFRLQLKVPIMVPSPTVGAEVIT